MYVAIGFYTCGEGRERGNKSRWEGGRVEREGKGRGKRRGERLTHREQMVPV